MAKRFHLPANSIDYTRVTIRLPCHVGNSVVTSGLSQKEYSDLEMLQLEEDSTYDIRLASLEASQDDSLKDLTHLDMKVLEWCSLKQLPCYHRTTGPRPWEWSPCYDLGYRTV